MYNAVKLGSFQITSGKARISDPCYDLETWCAGTLDAVKNGDWKAQVLKKDMGDWGNRCGVLIAHHGDNPVTYEYSGWNKEAIDVGVDSGQAGIFDLAHFKDDDSVRGLTRESVQGTICEDEPFYSFCCDRTLSRIGAGTIPYGVISSSGYGDGGYECYTVTEHGEIVAIMIDFCLGGEEDDDE